MRFPLIYNPNNQIWLCVNFRLRFICELYTFTNIFSSTYKYIWRLVCVFLVLCSSSYLNNLHVETARYLIKEGTLSLTEHQELYLLMLGNG